MIELRSHFHYIAKSIQTTVQLSVYIHHLLCRNYYISYCLCAGLVQLQLIPQVHYINNATFKNKYSHVIHTNLICTEQSCKLKEFNRQTANMKCRFIILRCVILFVLSNNKNKLNGTYVYRHKHNYIRYSTFTITKVKLHVPAINFGHLQVVHEALNDKLYLHVSGEFTVCGLGSVRNLFLCF